MGLVLFYRGLLVLFLSSFCACFCTSTFLPSCVQWPSLSPPSRYLSFSSPALHTSSLYVPHSDATLMSRPKSDRFFFVVPPFFLRCVPSLQMTPPPQHPAFFSSNFPFTLKCAGGPPRDLPPDHPAPHVTTCLFFFFFFFTDFSLIQLVRPGFSMPRSSFSG